MTAPARLAELRRYWQGIDQTDADARDVLALLTVAERAQTLLSALRTTGEADCAYAIRRWVQHDGADLHRDEVAVFEALTALDAALGTGL